MCRIHSILTQAENPALTVNPFTNPNSDGGLNYARCAPVLPRLDSCPGVKDQFALSSNMSRLQNSSAISQTKRNTRAASWAESFVDLSEFCYQTFTHIRMADSGDERNTSPISSAVQQRGFGNLSDGNLENLFEDNKWYASSPVVMQEELSDSLTDWLASSKDSTCCMIDNDECSLLSIETPAIDGNTNSSTTTDLLLSEQQAETAALLSTTSSQQMNADDIIMEYKIKNDPLLSGTLVASPPAHLQPDSTYSNVEAIITSMHSQEIPPFASFKPKLNILPTRTTTNTTTTTASTAASSSHDVQSPSISQSHLNPEESPLSSSTEFKIPSPGLVKRRNVKLDLKLGDNTFVPPSSMNTPEVLKPLVDKDLGFDLVSYVFEDNNKSVSSDITKADVEENYIIPDEAIHVHSQHSEHRQQQTLLEQRLLDIPVKSEPPDIDDVLIVGVTGTSHVEKDNDNDYKCEDELYDIGDSSISSLNSDFNFHSNINTNNSRNNNANLRVNFSSNNKKHTAITTNGKNVIKKNDNNDLTFLSTLRFRGGNSAVKRKFVDGDDDDDDYYDSDYEEKNGGYSGSGKIATTTVEGHHGSYKNSNNKSKDFPSVTSPAAPSKRRLSITDIALLESEKYRELRDRNNEASRRSRANRKTREMELQTKAETLEAQNRSLKMRTERMEQLVKQLRASLMKLVLKNRLP